MLEPGSGPAHARNRSGSEGRDDAKRAANAVVCGGVVAQTPAGGRGWQAFCGGGSSGRGGASRRRRAVIGERFLGLWGLWPAVKPHRNLDFRRCRESPHPGEGLLFRKEAKARAVLGLAEPVHPLPHLPRQAACLGGIPVCIPHAAGAAYSSSTVRQIGTRLWPCACAQWGGSKGRADAERANAAA